jgi:anti-sigma B factor antagonist
MCRTVRPLRPSVRASMLCGRPFRDRRCPTPDVPTVPGLGSPTLRSQEVVQMPATGFAVEVVCGVPVVTTPEEIDITNAAGLWAALLDAAAHGHGTVVVDMARTQFCDSAGLHALVRAHKRSQTEGDEVLVVIFATTVLRVFAISGLDRVIPNFSSLDEALAVASAARPTTSSSALTARSQLRSVLLTGAGQRLARLLPAQAHRNGAGVRYMCSENVLDREKGMGGWHHCRGPGVSR